MRRFLNKLMRSMRWRSRDVAVEMPSAKNGNRYYADTDRFLDYGEIRTSSNYTPWAADQSFLRVYESIKRFTLVDIYRCWELWTLIGQSAKIPGEIIEIGTWKGGSGALIAQRAKICGINSRVYLCDTFAGVVKVGQNDPYYKGGEHADASRSSVEELVFKRLNLDNVKILEGIFPDDSAHLIEDPGVTFRFCHIDVDVYQSAKDVMNWIWPRVSKGGIVVYDDYGFLGTDGVTRFVNEQINIDDRIVVHNLNGHGIVIKIG